MSAWRVVTLLFATSVLVETKNYNKRSTNVDICDRAVADKVQCYCYHHSTSQETIIAADCYLKNENVQPEDKIWDSFEKLNTVKQIIFTNTQGHMLKYIPSKALNHTKNMMKLVIKYESIETLPSFAFESLQQIEELTLRSDQILTLAKNAFANHERLKTLSLDENKIVEINRDVFVNLPALKTLYLNENEINTIHDRAFIHMKSLKELEVYKNNLFSLNVETFAGLRELEKLNLQANNLEVIGDNTFSPLVELRSLILGNNKIQMLDDRAFNGLTKLENLNLANNKLTVLANDHIFHGLSSLMELNLHGNQIREFKFEVIQPILQNFYESSSSFDIDNNTFPCSCQLDWFHDLMNKTRNNTTKLALDNLQCEPNESLRQSYDALIKTQKAEESQNQDNNDYDYYDESQLGGKLFYTDLRELLNCTGTKTNPTTTESGTRYSQTTDASFNPSITDYTAMTSTYNPVSTTKFTPAKVTNQGVLDLSLETTVKTTNTPNVFYSEMKKDNLTDSYTTNRLATVSAKPKRDNDDVGYISRKKYEDMASDEAVPESTKGHKRDYPSEKKPNNSSHKIYSCAFLSLLTLLLGKYCFN